MLDPTIVTLASVPAVLAVVNLLKELGMPSKLSALVALILAALFVFGEAHLAEDLWANITSALVLGLGAAGLYDVTQGTAKAARQNDLKVAELERETALAVAASAGGFATSEPVVHKTSLESPGEL